jgi:hypothetical protein
MAYKKPTPEMVAKFKREAAADRAEVMRAMLRAPEGCILVDGKVIEIDNSQPLDKLINDMVEAESNAYGSHIRIAAKLNDLMEFPWFDIANEERSDNATVFAPYWKAVYAGFRKAGHSNPSVPGKRIRDYGRNLRAGLAPNGKTMADGAPLPAGEGEGEGEGANPAKRSDMLFSVEESIRLWKRNNKSDNATLVAYAEYLAKGMKQFLNVDVRTVK